MKLQDSLSRLGGAAAGRLDHRYRGSGGPTGEAHRDCDDESVGWPGELQAAIAAKLPAAAVGELSLRLPFVLN